MWGKKKITLTTEQQAGAESRVRMDRILLELEVVENTYNNIEDEELAGIYFKKIQVLREELNYICKKAKERGAANVGLKICR